MQWILGNPQIHSTFGSLGFHRDGVYHVTDDCLSSLDSIYLKLLKDNNTCSFRKAIGLGKNIKNDLIPLILYTKNKEILEKTIKILVNLTIPVECLLPQETIYQSSSGRYTLLDLNNLLISAKQTFVNNNNIKAVLDIVKEIIEQDKDKLHPEECETINNCIILLRNILHIPEIGNKQKKIEINVQNQILWNLFTIGIDKILLSLITSSQSASWSIAIVQLISLLYKDQPHDVLQKLLCNSLDTLSESSDDNESNTSPSNRGSGDHNATSDLTFLYSERCISPDNKLQQKTNQNDYIYNNYSLESNSKKIKLTVPDSMMTDEFQESSLPQGTIHTLSNKVTDDNDSGVHISKIENEDSQDPVFNHKYKCTRRIHRKTKLLPRIDNRTPVSSDSSIIENIKRKKPKIEKSVLSDPGYYSAQQKMLESVSTSSNEDDSKKIKEVHKKTHGKKQRQTNKSQIQFKQQDKQDLQRKKIVKRGKSNRIAMKGIINHKPTNENVSYILKEFTVDFVLKGYNNLVKNLHREITTNVWVQIDTSHFFWLITYFLKFATHLKVDLEYISFVLSYDVLSLVISEGVKLCEQIEILKQSGSDLQPFTRRLHLVITAIKEHLVAIKSYKKNPHLSEKEQEYLNNMKLNICHTKQLRCLFVLLLRFYHPEVHSKQYLQDLILTNHKLLSFLDNENINVKEHLKQFADVTIITNYGSLLEDFRNNSEKVNDSIFNMLHHVAGGLNVSILFQPSILKAFSLMSESNREMCIEWMDLIQWTLRSFAAKTDSDSSNVQPLNSIPMDTLPLDNSDANSESWDEEDAQLLSWCYTRSLQCEDPIQNIMDLYSESASKDKSKISVIKQLYAQNIIGTEEYNVFIHRDDKNKDPQKCSDDIIKPTIDNADCDLNNLLEKLKLNNISCTWIQTALLEACYTKLSVIDNENQNLRNNVMPNSYIHYEPVSFYHIITKQAVPIIVWNKEQDIACNNSVFLQVMRNLGLYLPRDTRKIYIRIPEQWTPEIIFETALKIGSIDSNMESIFD